jgi:type IV pilus assembly protein PilM
MTSAHSRTNFFPPPKFLAPLGAGVDISDRSIKYVEFGMGERGRKILAYGEVPLEPGIVEAGKILAGERLVTALKDMAKKGKLSFVHAALPEEQMYFFTMAVPAGTHEEMRQAIELGLEEHVPIAASEAVFDFQVTNTTATDVQVAVTAASRDIIEEYASTFSGAGLVLLSLELEAEAIARAVTHADDATTRMIIDFGETRTGIIVVSHGFVRFTSTVAVGGRMLTETLAKHFSVSLEEAEKMKRQYGLRRNSPNQDLFSLLLNNVAVLRDEINRHFIYWHTHAEEGGAARPAIEELVLVGGDSNLAGLADYLATSLRVKTTLGDVWTHASLSEGAVPDLSRNDSLGYATAVGLALHE